MKGLTALTREIDENLLKTAMKLSPPALSRHELLKPQLKDLSAFSSAPPLLRALLNLKIKAWSFNINCYGVSEFPLKNMKWRAGGGRVVDVCSVVW
jgi:hypothetical protein